MEVRKSPMSGMREVELRFVFLVLDWGNCCRRKESIMSNSGFVSGCCGGGRFVSGCSWVSGSKGNSGSKVGFVRREITADPSVVVLSGW